MQEDIPYIPISEPQRGSRKFGNHLSVLVKKQYVTHARSPKGIICIALSPLILCILLVVQQGVANNMEGMSTPSPPSYLMGGIPQCIPMNSEAGCITIGIGILVSLSILIQFLGRHDAMG